MKIVIISDTHNRHKKLVIPECDILISCGDYSFKGTKSEVKHFHEWMHQQSARHKISVQGNHELRVEEHFYESREIARAACPGVHFMDEGLVQIDGYKIWCSAITPHFHDWAWNRMGEAIIPHWEVIPDDINILVTHGPPLGILDAVPDIIERHVGCPYLADRIKHLKQLELHCFGHIHHSAGIHMEAGVTYVNAAICDERYYPSNPVRIIEL